MKLNKLFNRNKVDWEAKYLEELEKRVRLELMQHCEWIDKKLKNNTEKRPVGRPRIHPVKEVNLYGRGPKRGAKGYEEIALGDDSFKHNPPVAKGERRGESNEYTKLLDTIVRRGYSDKYISEKTGYCAPYVKWTLERYTKKVNTKYMWSKFYNVCDALDVDRKLVK